LLGVQALEDHRANLAASPVGFLTPERRLLHNQGVEVNPAAEAPARHPVRAVALVITGLVVVTVLAAVALYLWLGTYTPLSAQGSFAPGPGVATPADNSGGSKPAFVPAGERQTFDTAFTLHNTGRFAATVTDLAPGGASAAPRPLRLLVTDSATASADPGHLHAFRQLRLGPGDSAILVVRWQVGCADRGGSADTVGLRYEYLSLFEREQTVTLPFAVTVRCGASQTP
jgi:hypothetical protein